MSTGHQVKPTHKAVKDYYAALRTYAGQQVAHEGAVRSAFQNLLADTGRKFGWTLIPELTIDANGHQIRPDGTFRDEFTIERGYWEAKDTDDDLETEIAKKIKRGYRLTNTIFEDTRQAHLYQDGKPAYLADLTNPQQLCDLLNTFFRHTEPAHEDFSTAVDEFKQRVPDLARGLVDLINRAHDDNPRFAAAFGKFYDLCRQSLNPNLSTAAVDEMLVQHLLTERLIRTVFDSQDFTRRNVIAAEIERVIDALVSQSFNRHDYLKRLDRFYVAIEQAARTITGFAEKQHFLNVVYERFFQGYSVKVADTHGIVYTPQEIVDFMCASVAEVLEQEFGKKLGDAGVNILDPCTGTGNFIVNLIRRIPKRDLPRMYREQLFANEVMLLPYYIAALNIEHAYYERTGQYEPFEGLCFVD
ncbi:MAG: N-6 DNA methylase, partial [Planctomycetota bacterium]